MERTWGHSIIVLAIQLINKNIIKKIHRDLRWPPIDVFNSTTNQKWAGVEEKRVEKKDAGQDGDEVGFECLNSPLCLDLHVLSQGDEFVVHVIFFDACLHCRRAFVVEFLLF